MAGAGLLALIDDITTLLDDIASMSKVAAGKTAGVLGDDLALNAEQVSGVRAERELPVVWAVAKGSIKNKFIIVPVALLLSAFVPWLITPLLVIGGSYLCFEGFEKVFHHIAHRNDPEDHHVTKEVLNPAADMVALEKKKIAGAIRTDFILSAEIVVIVLGTVQAASMTEQILVVSLLALGITVIVYGVVAAIVKLDDVGLHLLKSARSGVVMIGRGILRFCPILMRTLSIVGTAAMFLVGGGILIHGFPWVHHLTESVAHLAFINQLPGWIFDILANAIVGIVYGGLLVGIFESVGKLRAKVVNAS
ncbi:DUF808 domain-containing protein [Proteobacteria bacterium 005FR1]|nr:DUF808 domain-containing protein [Proteobacteria bacterium 005FR1]